MTNYVGKIFNLHHSFGFILPIDIIRALKWDVDTRILIQVINKDEVKLTKIKLPNEPL